MVARTFTQRSFTRGKVDPRIWKNKNASGFEETLKNLRNMDILESGDLQKRTGVERVFHGDFSLSERIADVSMLQDGVGGFALEDVTFRAQGAGISYEFFLEYNEFMLIPLTTGDDLGIYISTVRGKVSRSGAVLWEGSIRILQQGVNTYTSRLTGQIIKGAPFIQFWPAGGRHVRIADDTADFGDRAFQLSDSVELGTDRQILFRLRNTGGNAGSHNDAFALRLGPINYTLKEFQYLLIEGLGVYLFPKYLVSGRLQNDEFIFSAEDGNIERPTNYNKSFGPPSKKDRLSTTSSSVSQTYHIRSLRPVAETYRAFYVGLDEARRVPHTQGPSIRFIDAFFNGAGYPFYYVGLGRLSQEVIQKLFWCFPGVGSSGGVLVPRGQVANLQYDNLKADAEGKIIARETVEAFLVYTGTDYLAYFRDAGTEAEAEIAAAIFRKGLEVYSAPEINVFRGYPAGGVLQDGRVLLSGGTDYLYASDGRTFRGFNLNLPTDKVISRDALTQILRGNDVALKEVPAATPDETDEQKNMRLALEAENRAIQAAMAAKPTSNSTANDVYWYLYQLGYNPDSGINTFVPFQIRVPSAEGVNKVQWIAKIRDVIVGTDSDEVIGQTPNSRPITNVNDLSLRQSHSFRGSSSSLTARGDYALFFLGEDKRTIWYMHYDDGVSGYRTEEATILYKMKTEIRDMVWDNKRKGLLVLTEGNTLHMFYLNKEYGVMGFSDWDFPEGFGEQEVVTNFEGTKEKRPMKINKLIYYRGRLGFFTANPIGFYLFKEFDSDNDEDYADLTGDEAVDIETETDFFKSGEGGGESGDAAGWFKAVQYSTLYHNGTELFAGPERVRKIYSKKGPKEGRDFGHYVENNKSALPSLVIRHTRREKFQIYSTTSKIDIQEM